jgi:SAM-dependent methyltransferase
MNALREAVPTPPDRFFRCLNCGGGDVAALPDEWTCRGCGSPYRVIDGIPLLVRDWRAHEEELARARESNPDWYVVEQPPEAVSPWRHHLVKRRRYVESVLRRELAARGLTRAPRLLDLGCGDGNNLLWLAPFGEQVYGSDYNLVRLGRARQRCPGATLFLADVLDYAARDDGFDVIFFNHVIEHIRDDLTALKSVGRILKPGGLLVLGTPNEGAWWWQLAYKRSPETLKTTDHVHFYTVGTIAAKMKAAGLRLIETKHLGWGPPDWYWDGRLRQHKWVDDLFEYVGRALLPRQASSLYLIASKDG